MNWEKRTAAASVAAAAATAQWVDSYYRYIKSHAKSAKIPQHRTLDTRSSKWNVGVGAACLYFQVYTHNFNTRFVVFSFPFSFSFSLCYFCIVCVDSFSLFSFSAPSIIWLFSLFFHLSVILFFHEACQFNTYTFLYIYIQGSISISGFSVVSILSFHGPVFLFAVLFSCRKLYVRMCAAETHLLKAFKLSQPNRDGQSCKRLFILFNGVTVFIIPHVQQTPTSYEKVRDRKRKS